jgi:hypothetical protein
MNMQRRTLIEDHGIAGDLSPERPADANRAWMRAGAMCYQGRVDEAVALYDGVKTAVGSAQVGKQALRGWRGLMPTDLPERSRTKATFRSEIEAFVATCLLTLVLFATFTCLSASFGSNVISNINIFANEELCLDGTADPR